MENRINQVVKLDNGSKFIILRQVIYKNDSYFIASRLDENNNPLADDLTFFHQIDDGHLKLEEVTDLELMKYLYSYMKI